MNGDNDQRVSTAIPSRDTVSVAVSVRVAGRVIEIHELALLRHFESDITGCYKTLITDIYGKDGAHND